MEQDDDTRALVRALDAFELSPGVPDTTRRRQFLAALVDGLPFSDRRFLHDLLQEKALIIDLVQKLPVEVILHIADYIGSPKDIIHFRAVSKTWHSIWNNTRVIKALFNSQFPGTLDAVAKSGTPQTPDELARLYREKHRHFLRRQNGKYDSTTAGYWRYPYDSNFTVAATVPPLDSIRLGAREDSEPPIDFEYGQNLYSDGRIAWKHGIHFIVDNLRSMERIIYQVPPTTKLTGPKLNIEALGEKLLVASIGRTAFVWDLETHKMEKLTLPTPISACYVGGTTVGIMTASPFAGYVYNFGGSLQRLRIPTQLATKFGAAKKRDRDVGMIIDPDVLNTVFLVGVSKERDKEEEQTDDEMNVDDWDTRQKRKKRIIYVVAKFRGLEFEKQWDRASIFESFSGTGICSVRCYKANDMGLYTLVLDSTNDFHPCQKFPTEHECDIPYNYCWELMFDTRKERFFSHHYHVPYDEGDDVLTGLMDICAKYKTWNGRMVVAVEHSDGLTTVTECENTHHASALIATLPACGIDEDTRPFRCVEPVGAMKGTMPWESRHGARHELLCCWDPCPDLDMEAVLEPWQFELSQRFDGDENFIITFGVKGYSTWSFNHAMRTKHTEEELRELYGMPREVLRDEDEEDDMDDEDDVWEDENSEVDDMIAQMMEDLESDNGDTESDDLAMGDYNYDGDLHYGADYDNEDEMPEDY